MAVDDNVQSFRVAVSLFVSSLPVNDTATQITIVAAAICLLIESIS